MMNNKNAKFNKNEDGITSAVDTLAEVSLSDGRDLSFKSCVSGIVLETNPRFQNHSGHQALGDTFEYPNMKENPKNLQKRQRNPDIRVQRANSVKNWRFTLRGVKDKTQILEPRRDDD